MEGTMSEKMTRRDFVKISGLAAGLGAIGSVGCAQTSQAVAGGSKAAMVGMGVKAPLPAAKGPRLVVVGAGTSGLTIAKYAKKNYPKFDVVMVDKRDMYSSCFNSSLWYAGIVDLEFHSQFPGCGGKQRLHLLQFHCNRTGPRFPHADHQRRRDQLRLSGDGARYLV